MNTAMVAVVYFNLVVTSRIEAYSNEFTNKRVEIRHSFLSFVTFIHQATFCYFGDSLKSNNSSRVNWRQLHMYKGYYFAFF